MNKPCTQCKKPFRKPSKFSQRQWEASKYCGFTCWGIHQSENMKGNSLFKGKRHTEEAKRKVGIANFKVNAVKRIPGYYSHKSLERYARLKGAEGSFSLQEWELKKKDFDYQCNNCGSTSRKLTKDHIIPLTKGGSNYISNIQPLCQSCNSRKSNKVLALSQWN